MACLRFYVVLELYSALWLTTIVTAEWTNVAMAGAVPLVLLAMSSGRRCALRSCRCLSCAHES